MRDSRSYTDELRYQITLERRSFDDKNREIFTPYAPDIWCGVKEVAESESLEGNDYIVTTDFVFRIRYRNDVKTTDRVKRTIDGQDVYLGVISITDPKQDKRYLLIRARISEPSV